jgi:hypothetical protein
MAQDYISLAVMGVVLYAAFKHKDELVAMLNDAIGGLNAVAPAAGGGGGPISQEGSCPAGEACQQDGQGRYDCDEPKGDSYESTWCGSFSGDDLTIKLYGPQHSNDGDCCWCVLHVKPDSGQFVGGGEGPHPNSNCEDKGDGESIGTTSNICVKAVIQPGPTVTGYALMNGQWQQMITWTGPCGCDETSSSKTGDQVTFRNDGSFDTTCATVRPLGGGIAASYARANKIRRAYITNLNKRRSRMKMNV